MRDGLLPAPFTNLTGIFFLLVLGISAVQLAALYSFFNDYLDWSALFAAPVATLLAGVPLLSSILGIIAAYKQEKYASFGAENFGDASRAAVEDMAADIRQALEAR